MKMNKCKIKKSNNIQIKGNLRMSGRKDYKFNNFSGDMDNYLLDLEEDLGFTEFRKRYVVAEEFIHQKVSQSLLQLCSLQL